MLAASLLVAANHSSIAQIWRPRDQAPATQNVQNAGVQQVRMSRPTTMDVRATYPMDSGRTSLFTRESATNAVAQPDHNSGAIAGQLDKLNLSEGEFDWRQDWWKYLIIAVVVICLALLLIRIGNTLLRLLAFIGCLAFATGAAYCFGGLFAPTLGTLAPWLEFPQCPILYWSYFIVFLTAYVIATVILWIIKRPFDITSDKKKS